MKGFEEGVGVLDCCLFLSVVGPGPPSKSEGEETTDVNDLLGNNKGGSFFSATGPRLAEVGASLP